MRISRSSLIAVFIFVCGIATRVFAESYSLQEMDSSRAIRTDMTATFTGSLFVQQSGEKLGKLSLNVDATARFDERRLPPSGRDELAYRALRNYRQMSAEIDVNQEKNRLSLPSNLRLLVAEGQREGIMLYSQELILSRNNIDLLNVPGDPLAVLPLLPPTDVEVGQEWSPDSWAVQMLSAVEAVTDSKMTCKLSQVQGDVATITFEGSVKGAVVGAETEISISGKYAFDLDENLITSIELTQKEKRSVGTVNPGMDVEAKVVCRREAIEVPAALSDTKLDSVPLDPGEKAKLLTFQPNGWQLRFFHDRNWYLFQEVPEVVILRLIESGSLIAQCNVARIRSVAPGEHTSEERFQEDIARSLGERLKEIVSADQLKVRDNRYIYRVIVEGAANNLEMVWVYYLVANPDGRQISFVFAVEKKLLKQLDARDVDIVTSTQFLTKN